MLQSPCDATLGVFNAWTLRTGRVTYWSRRSRSGSYRAGDDDSTMLAHHLRASQPLVRVLGANQPAGRPGRFPSRRL